MSKNNFKEQVEAGDAAIAAQDWQGSILAWRAVLENRIHKTPPKAYVRLSYSYRKLNRLAEARNIVHLGLKKHPEHLPLLIEEALLLMEEHRPVEAILKWNLIISRFPNEVPPAVWAKLSQSYRSNDDLTSARDAAMKGHANNPDNEIIMTELARISSAMKDWAEAEKWWSAVYEIQKGKAPPETLESLARALRFNKKLEQAGDIIQNGLESDPENQSLLTEQAQIETAKQEWRSALKLWQKVFGSLDEKEEGKRLYARLHISVIERLMNLSTYKKHIRDYSAKLEKTKRKVAVVTSFTKGYDSLKPHEFLDSRFDFVAYTDSDEGGMGIFDVRPLRETELDAARASRYAKTHPHSLFPEYDLVVWIDASLMIVGDIYPILDEFMKSGKPVGASTHPLRKSIHEEFEACVKLKKDNVDDMKRQLEFYEQEGFDGNDIAECGFLAFNLKDFREEVSSAMNTWWDQICKFSKRDQLSFTYSLYKHGLKWHPLTSPPKGLRNHPDFILASHNQEYEVLDILSQNLNEA